MIEKNRILVVDDDTTFLETFSTVLKEEGFVVFKATTAESGFEALVNNVTNLVILDINLPDKSGFDVLVSIKNSKNFASIPVILITADTAVNIDTAFEKGADDCVFKPMNMEETINRIKKLLK